MQTPSEGWHEEGCRRPDVILLENTPTCISCGSIYTHTERADVSQKELDILPPIDGNLSTRTKLHLDWPSTIAFSSPDDIADADQRKTLEWFRKIRAEPNFVLYAYDEEAQDGHRPDISFARLERLWRQFKTESIPMETWDNTNRETAILGSGNETTSHHSYSSRLYRPLRGPDEIRLLHLSPCSEGNSQVIHGTLVPAYLSERPEFTALSYTWADASGNRSRFETLFMGSEWVPLPITANCAAALRRLRSSSQVRVIWVDAICIDQRNTSERGHQVGLMRDIYSRAVKVISFLGDDAPGLEQSSEGKLMARMADDYFYKGSTVQIYWPPRDERAVQALFERPYWRRVWVIQEVLLAREALVVLGGSSVPLACVLRGRMARRDPKHIFPQWLQLSGPSAASDLDAFFELLATTSYCLASDRRDKVFALLGLVPGANLEGLVADYTKTPEDIYIGIAAYFLMRHGQVNILKWALLTNGTPSWVPTWTNAFDFRPKVKISHDNHADFQTELVSFRLVEMLDSAQDIAPDLQCRGSGSRPWRAADVLDVLRPRVFKSTGALLIRAYPVVQPDLFWAREGLKSSEHKIEGDHIVLQCSAGLERSENSVRWAIFGKVPYSEYDHSTDWVVEVPSCDIFLQLKPNPVVPGLYSLASVCHLALAANVPFSHLMQPVDREQRSFDPYLLLLRLVLIKPRHLIFLQSWQALVHAHSCLKPALGMQPELTSMDLMQYTRWLEHLLQYPELLLGPTVDENTINFEYTLRKVATYLDGWSNLTMWDYISKILDLIDWPAHIKRLEEIRKEAVSNLIETRLSTKDTDSNHTEEIWREVKQQTGSQVEELLQNLMGDVDKLYVDDLKGETLHLGEFRLADTAARLRAGVESISALWDADKIRDMEPECFSEWTAFGSCLRYMRDSKAEYGEIKVKFVQRKALKQLYTRAEPREFLIC